MTKGKAQQDIWSFLVTQDLHWNIRIATNWLPTSFTHWRSRMTIVSSANSITIHDSGLFANNVISLSLVLLSQVSNITLNVYNVLIVWPMSNKVKMDHVLNTVDKLIADTIFPWSRIHIALDVIKRSLSSLWNITVILERSGIPNVTWFKRYYNGMFTCIFTNTTIHYSSGIYDWWMQWTWHSVMVWYY